MTRFERLMAAVVALLVAALVVLAWLIVGAGIL
jgi:hypothetical protein